MSLSEDSSNVPKATDGTKATKQVEEEDAPDVVNENGTAWPIANGVRFLCTDDWTSGQSVYASDFLPDWRATARAIGTAVSILRNTRRGGVQNVNVAGLPSSASLEDVFMRYRPVEPGSLHRSSRGNSDAPATKALWVISQRGDVDGPISISFSGARPSNDDLEGLKSKLQKLPKLQDDEIWLKEPCWSVLTLEDGDQSETPSEIPAIMRRHKYGVSFHPQPQSSSE